MSIRNGTKSAGRGTNLKRLAEQADTTLEFARELGASGYKRPGEPMGDKAPGKNPGNVTKFRGGCPQ